MSAEQIRELELENQRDTIRLQYNQILKMKRLTSGANFNLVYPNQAEAAAEIISQYARGARWVVLVAPPGAGKTGVILDVLRQLGEHNDSRYQIRIDDMLLMTGMSDTDWTKTMTDGMLPAFANTIYHRGALRRREGLDSMANGIIVTDECHVAAAENQTIDKTLLRAGLKDIDALRERNMRMLDVSATPEGVLADLQKWRAETAVVMLRPDEKYKGFQTMKDESRLLNAKEYDLNEYDSAKKLLQFFENRYKDSKTKKYFAFRIYSAAAEGNIRNACKSLGWDCTSHNSKDRVDKIDSEMELAPTKHKVFLVKGFWRASKRLVRKHVGGTYESPTARPDDTGKSQGLTARFCNTFDWEGEQVEVAKRPIHFDDVDSIDRYLAWWSKDCDYMAAAYKAPRLESDGAGKVRHPKTKANPEGIVGVEADEDPAPPAPAPAPKKKRGPKPGAAKKEKVEFKAVRFNVETTVEAAVELIKTYLATTEGLLERVRAFKIDRRTMRNFGPKHRNAEGRYTYGMGKKGIELPRTYSEVSTARVGLARDNPVRLSPCYDGDQLVVCLRYITKLD